MIIKFTWLDTYALCSFKEIQMIEVNDSICALEINIQVYFNIYRTFLFNIINQNRNLPAIFYETVSYEIVRLLSLKELYSF